MSFASELAYSARHPWARAGAVVLFLSVTFFGIVAAAWWPLERDTRALEQAVAEKRRALLRARESEALAAAYAQAHKDAAALERKLAHGATQAQLVQSFARLARRHGVKVVSETYEEGRNAAQPALSAELTVQAAYPALREFVRELAALPTWSEVQEVRIENAAGGGATQKGRIRIVTYRAAPVRS
jgi:hypothetical protein